LGFHPGVFVLGLLVRMAAMAEEALDRCIKKGGWVFFQNIHLMSMWVKQFERNLEGSPRFPAFESPWGTMNE
jgi:hypothetical protein